MSQRVQSYQSNQPQWERTASVRSKPRRLLTDEENPGFYFPPEQQMLCVHPLVEKMGTEVKETILIHSLYKYLNDIANIEKDIINQTAYKITQNDYFIDLPRDIRHDALSVIIDESYHAYVALDFLQQVEVKTSILALDLPKDTALSYAIKSIKAELPKQYIENFELIATCIAEHALTNDLIAVSKSQNISRTFFYIMKDHAQDEGRHARYFEYLLAIFWEALPIEQKEIIGSFLPKLIHQYFNPAIQKTYDEQILKSLNISPEKIQIILSDTHDGWSDHLINQENIIAKQMINLLKRTKVIETQSVKQAFESFLLV
ncbi:diiron oxygenase [Legionella dresdenensis]|uniref:Diiron oxygenase n=1 Tax=Legionella dresdenensis TaxID=450200 RepID=A0ABV8CBZ9_9GAMM